MNDKKENSVDREGSQGMSQYKIFLRQQIVAEIANETRVLEFLFICFGH
jgi:hypothetical protein